MDTFEITDEEINVEEIMERIRENIKKRKEAGIYTENEPKLISETFSTISSSKEDVPEGLEFINNCDICNESYIISSHRPVVGKFLVEGRKIVHGEIRRYVDSVFRKQREFNFNVAQALKNISKNLNSSSHKIENSINEIEQLKTELKNSANETDNLKNEIENLKINFMKNIRSEVNDVINTINMDLENKSWLNSVLEYRLNENLQNHKVMSPEDYESVVNYYLFEERFRGARDNIQQHQKAFLDYFKNCKNVLDIGCGRGEFLELAGQNNIVAKGIDIDEDMIEFCKSKGFDVELKDAIEALESLEDKSLDGIFISQVVEHLAPEYLIKMLNLCNKKLKYNFYLVVETVNPLSLFSFANFYIDLTHIKPVHPETLRFLFSAVDFHEIETKFISPVPESMRLKKLPGCEDPNDREIMMFETYNQNIDMLNDTLYGAQDYVLIGKK